MPSPETLERYTKNADARRNVGPTTDSVTSITYSGLVNFTNKDPTGPASGNCLINSLVYNEAQPLQEVLGEVTQLEVDNIDQHPYHHHIQPYQIVSLPNDTDAFNSLWRVSAVDSVHNDTTTLVRIAAACSKGWTSAFLHSSCASGPVQLR